MTEHNNQIWNFIISSDKFGSNIDLLFKKDKIHRTFLGGLITLSIYVVSIFLAYIFGQELWIKSKPTTNFSEETVFQPEKFDMNYTNYVFIFGIQFRNWTHYIDPTIYQVTAVQKNMKKYWNDKLQKKEISSDEKELILERCTQQYYKDANVYEQLKELPGIYDMYCFQKDNGMYIEGDFEANAFSAIEISIKACNQEEEDQKKAQGKPYVICQDKNIINEVLETAQLNSYFTDRLIDPKNLEQPFQKILKAQYWPVSNRISFIYFVEKKIKKQQIGKDINLYKRNIYMESDLGFLDQQINIKKGTVFQYQTEQIMFLKENQQFVHLVLRFEKAKQSRYFRQYQKLQDILAQVSGVSNLLLFIGYFICSKFSQFDLNYNLAGLILFINEFNEFNTTNIKSFMIISQIENDLVKANLDITIQGSPCHLLALDQQDDVGSHIADYIETLTKTKIINGIESPYTQQNVQNYRGSENEYQDLLQSIKDKEQCRFKGNVFLKKVPGNFHFSYHSKMDLYNKLKQKNKEEFQQLNLNFVINHLGFGQEQNQIQQLSIFGFNTNSYSPYDNMKFILEGKNDFDQYLKIIPVQYHYNKKGIHTNQYKYAMYTSNIERKQQEDIPQITFKYEVSPINIVYNTQKQSFYHFLVQVCAIVGGIFSVIGIINSLTSGVISKIRG